MGGRADSPPEWPHGTSTKPGTGAATVELHDADIDQQPPATDEGGIAPGTVLAGKYVIEREIGRGGIGIIVAAHHVHLDQKVAIKYLQRKVHGNAAILERFAREARLAAKISSDNVVRVHDVSSDPAIGPYMVMEYLEGTDLGHVVESGPLPIADAIDYILQACHALAEAHVLGIVHRDLKPDNLFLAKRAAGTSIVKILDFGISKAAPAQRGSGGWAHVTTATEKFGTPVYMSPEQLRSTANVDARSDVWALGVVLFELLTAEAPFTGESIAQLCTSILVDPPRKLRSLRPHASEALEATLIKCLEKDPARRYRNVAELAQDLSPFGPEEAPSKSRHIARVLKAAGSSVRPPTPMPGTYQLADARGGLQAASANLQAPVVEPSSGPTPSLEDIPGVPKRRQVVFVLAALGVALLLAALLFEELGARPAGLAPQASSTASAFPTAVAAATATALPTATATSTEATQPSASSAASVAEPDLPARQAPSVTAAPAHPRPPVAQPAKSSHRDDYSQFGERR